MFAAIAGFLAEAGTAIAGAEAAGAAGSGGIDITPISSAGAGNISGIGNNPLASAPDMSQPGNHRSQDAGTLLANLKNM